MLSLMGHAAQKGVILLPIEVRIRQASLRYAGHIFWRKAREEADLGNRVQANLLTSRLTHSPVAGDQPGMPSRQTYTKTLRSNLAAFDIPLESKPAEVKYSRGKNKAQTEATTWTTLAVSKGAWAKRANAVGVEKCMAGIMAKKKKQKLERERNRREDK